MFSTAADMVNFIQANVGVGVIQGEIVPPTIIAGMTKALTPHPDAVNTADTQALAWSVFPEDPTHKSRVRGKSGAIEGASSYIAVNPELKYGIVVLLNMDGVATEQAALNMMAELLPVAASGTQ